MKPAATRRGAALDRSSAASDVYKRQVIFPEGYANEEIKDSKKLTAKKRYALREEIQEKALAWAVGEVLPEEIDEINILNASILAMHRALDRLKVRPETVIVDGNRFKPYGGIPCDTIIKGDGKFLSIAAASILAKTYRDDYMERIDREYPQYLWRKNKGYPTAEQRDAIRKYGITKYHRRSFTQLPADEPQLPFDFEE